MSLKVTWDEYNTLVERLAHAVHESGFHFNQIICIARGGLRVGDVLSRIYDQPLAILSTHSYTSEGGTVRGDLVIAEHMTMTKPRLGDRVLLVDDMVDSGHTLRGRVQGTPQALPAHHGHPHRGAVVEGVLGLQARLFRRVPAGQSLDPPALRGLRQPSSRRPQGAPVRLNPRVLPLSSRVRYLVRDGAARAFRRQGDPCASRCRSSRRS